MNPKHLWELLANRISPDIDSVRLKITRIIDCGRFGGNLSLMEANPNQTATKIGRSDAASRGPAAPDDGLDSALLEESLAKTVWERMLANDDALHLADLLRTGMLKTRAKPE